MWIVGDWGQASPWARDSGVLMTKGDDDVWTGELSLPKGTKFDIKILKSTVSTTSGGANTWHAVRYVSTLNTSTSHDFGEFTDNLIPNGNFEEGHGKWTPDSCIVVSKAPVDGRQILSVGGDLPTSCASDVFVIPPNQTLRLTGYVSTSKADIDGIVTMKVVTPQQQTLFEFNVTTPTHPETTRDWYQFSKTFKAADVPMECRIVFSNMYVDTQWQSRVSFDSLSLVSP